jgi:hypothetical protein
LHPVSTLAKYTKDIKNAHIQEKEEKDEDPATVKILRMHTTTKRARRKRKRPRHGEQPLSTCTQTTTKKKTPGL